MGGINQIINIYSNINRMTDQQKRYGLGIILGIRLPCLRERRAGDASPCGPRRPLQSALPPLSNPSPTAYHLYIHRDKFDQNVNTVWVENNTSSYYHHAALTER